MALFRNYRIKFAADALMPSHILPVNSMLMSLGFGSHLRDHFPCMDYIMYRSLLRWIDCRMRVDNLSQCHPSDAFGEVALIIFYLLYGTWTLEGFQSGQQYSRRLRISDLYTCSITIVLICL